MTIAKRLIVLLAVPHLALVSLGVFTRLQLTTIETRSRFVAELQIPGLATLGNISRTFAELRVEARNQTRHERGGARERSLGIRARPGPSWPDCSMSMSATWSPTIGIAAC